MQAFELSSSWDVRTYLSESEAKEWAAAAAVEGALANDDGGSGSDEAHRCGVFVVLFSDGDISSCTDPNTGERDRDLPVYFVEGVATERSATGAPRAGNVDSEDGAAEPHSPSH